MSAFRRAGNAALSVNPLFSEVLGDLVPSLLLFSPVCPALGLTIWSEIGKALCTRASYVLGVPEGMWTLRAAGETVLVSGDLLR